MERDYIPTRTITFPVHVFPDRLQRIILELHDSNGFPADYTAASMMAAISVAIGNSHRVEVKRNWHESTILYIAIVGHPGACKSHPLAFAMQPLVNADWKNNLDYQKKYCEYQQAIAMSRKERVHAGFEQFPKEPKRLRYLVSDVTQEGLSAIHSHNPRGLCLWVDELSAWFKNFTRYNNGSEEQFWLSASMAARQCPTARTRKTPSSSSDRSSRLSGLFRNVCLLNLPTVREQPTGSSTASFSLCRNLPANRNAEMCDNEMNDTVVSFFCKLEIYVIRFSLLLRMARWVCEVEQSPPEEIRDDDVTGAIELAEYFRSNALSILTCISEERLNELHRTVYDHLAEEFSTADGIRVAARFGMKDHTFKMFLTRNLNTLFRRVRQGLYRKQSCYSANNVTPPENESKSE